ncbi:MAG: hypothetical protein E3J21_16135 [Anaerolineales bacterium]|nr:MAG: hypothetical protein E3J21_16135 [Anaerolineales bacterium]
MRETTFASQQTPKRVEQLKSAEISQVGCNRWLGRHTSGSSPRYTVHRSHKAANETSIVPSIQAACNGRRFRSSNATNAPTRGSRIGRGTA